MKILIAVPSKNRADRIKDLTLNWLDIVDIDWQVFVEPQDFENYKKIIPEKNLIQIDGNNRGLGFSKSYIKYYAIQNNYDLIFKLDDDLEGWYGRSRNQRESISYEVFTEAINDGLIAFIKYPEVKAISYPYAWQMYEKDKWIGINQRLQSSYFLRTDSFFGDPRFSTFEDIANFIYIRKNNGIVLRYGWAGQNIEDVGKNPGGHQDFNRKEQALNEIKLLREIHPGLKVKRVFGKNWDLEPDMNDEFLRGK